MCYNLFDAKDYFTGKSVVHSSGGGYTEKNVILKVERNPCAINSLSEKTRDNMTTQNEEYPCRIRLAGA